MFARITNDGADQLVDFRHGCHKRGELIRAGRAGPKVPSVRGDGKAQHSPRVGVLLGHPLTRFGVELGGTFRVQVVFDIRVLHAQCDGIGRHSGVIGIRVLGGSAGDCIDGFRYLPSELCVDGIAGDAGVLNDVIQPRHYFYGISLAAISGPGRYPLRMADVGLTGPVHLARMRGSREVPGGLGTASGGEQDRAAWRECSGTALGELRQAEAQGTAGGGEHL